MLNRYTLHTVPAFPLSLQHFPECPGNLYVCNYELKEVGVAGLGPGQRATSCPRKLLFIIIPATIPLLPILRLGRMAELSWRS